MGLFDGIQQIVDTASAAPLTGDLETAESKHHLQYHKRIVFVGSCFAAVGLLLGLATSLGMASEVETARDIKGLFLVPVMFGAGGFVFGMALMCLLAPRAFLSGPVGERWMKLIGTESILAARIVCLLFGLIITFPLLGLGVLLAMSD